MHASISPPEDIASNPNVDEYLRQEGMTEDEWKRVYDLRYCTILVPFEDDSDREDAKQDHKRKERLASSSPEEFFDYQRMSTPPRSQGQRQLATPKSTQRHQVPSHALSNQVPRTPTRNIGLQTPAEGQFMKSSNQAHTQRQDLEISNNQENDLVDGDVNALTPSDPLASYLPAARTNIRRSIDATVDDEDMELFHDALDLHDGVDQAEGSGSSRAGLKRRHWELDQTSRLMQPTQPSAMKRVALTSSFISTTSVATAGLLKPISFSPNPIPIISQRRGSGASDLSSVSYQSFSQNRLWTTKDWKTLEDVYYRMDGNTMVEADLVQVVDRFLEEQEAQTGEKSIWTREKVLMRCIALFRVRNEPVDHNQRLKRSGQEPTLLSAGLRSASRRFAQPYPVQNFSRSKASSTPPVGANGTSSSAIADFLSHRRADRNQKQRDTDQGYQIKSVFKHRLASGLRTVSQLIPFWKDVEQGNTDIKGKEKVPLGVPLGTAQSVIETFESKSLESECGGSGFSRSGSVLSSSDSNFEGARNTPTMSLPSSSSSPGSVAEMLARGYSARAASVASETSFA